jgi:hypothetical protein
MDDWRTDVVGGVLRRREAAVVTLQSGVRGMVGRRLAAEQHTRRAQEERSLFFNLCAGLIQRHWRGYRSRKHVHDFYGRRSWLEKVLKVRPWIDSVSCASTAA